MPELVDLRLKAAEDLLRGHDCEPGEIVRPKHPKLKLYHRHAFVRKQGNDPGNVDPAGHEVKLFVKYEEA